MNNSFENFKSHIESPQTVFKKWGTVILCSFFAFVFLLCIFMPKPTHSESENRDLEKKPVLTFQSYKSGEYASSYSKYFTETFPFREKLLSMLSGFEDFYGVRVDNVKIHGGGTSSENILPDVEITQPDSSSSANSENSTTSESSSSSIPEPPKDADSNIGVVTNGVVVVGNRAMSIYGGNKNMAKAYAETISSYKSLFPATTKIYNIIIPTSVEFYLPEKYKNMSAPIKPVIDLIQTTLSPDINWVDAYSAISAHTDEYIYFRTDHHWTQRGAYYAYEAYCKKAGLTPVPLSDFTEIKKDKFTGTMFSYTQDKILKDEPDEFTYYKPKTEATSMVYKLGSRYSPVSTFVFHDYASGGLSYSTFLGGDYPLTVISTNAGTGKSVAVIKESYGNAFVPFLINHYDKIYVLDQRYYERSLPQLVQDESIGEVIFINNAFAATTGAHIKWIDGLKYENPLASPPESSSEQPPESSSDSASDQTQEILNTIFGQG